MLNSSDYLLNCLVKLKTIMCEEHYNINNYYSDCSDLQQHHKVYFFSCHFCHSDDMYMS